MQRITGLRHVATKPPSGIFARRLQTTSSRPASARRSRAPPAPESRVGQLLRKEKEAAEFEERKEIVERFWSPNTRRFFTIGSMIIGALMGFYILQLYYAVAKAKRNPGVKELSNQKDVAGRYDDTADGFDGDVGLYEWWGGINKERKKLAQKCVGHVLEVSCGTGRNLGYYDIGLMGKVDSLTFIDISPQMIDVCKKKWDALQSSYNKKWFASEPLKKSLTIRFLPASALGAMPLAPNGKNYDTIIQTMGLCSTPSPVELLTNMVKYLDTSNPDARILLLEHGRSYQSWMNKVLDGSAEQHAEVHGCWYNREISDLVQEAAKQTGMEVVSERRRHLGTLYVFELKPKATTSQNKDEEVPTATSDATSKWNPKTWFSYS